jgi:hypothetical protein
MAGFFYLQFHLGGKMEGQKERFFIAENTHWYNKNGAPMYESNLRDARKDELYPGFTKVWGDVINAPGLNTWKRNQILDAVINFPRDEEEDEKEYRRQIVRMADEYGAKAADLGVRIHTALELYILEGKEYLSEVPIELHDNVQKVMRWMDEYLYEIEPEATFCNHEYGFAGKIDVKAKHRDFGVIMLDFKSQNVKMERGKWAPRFDLKHEAQLAAYSTGTDVPDTNLFNIIIPTNPECDYSDITKYIKRWPTVRQKLSTKELTVSEAREVFLSALNIFKITNRLPHLGA